MKKEIENQKKEQLEALRKGLSRMFKVVRFLQLGNEHFFVVVEFNIPNFGIVNKEVMIPLNDTKTGKLKNYIPEAFSIPGISPNDQLYLIRDQINDALIDAKPERLLPQGYTLLDLEKNKWVYVLGDRIMGEFDPEDIKLYAHNPQKIKIREGSCKSDEIMHWFYLFCYQGTDKTALLLTSLTPLLRPILYSLGLTELRPVSAMFVGPSGSGKSSFATLVSSYGETDTAQGSNLSSDKQSVFEKLVGYSDRPFLVDDLNKSSAERELQKKLTKLSELLQMSHAQGEINLDDTTIDMSRISLVITSEILLEHPSAINRTLLIYGSPDFDSVSLSRLQGSQFVYTAFVMKLAQFICLNCERLANEIREGLVHGRFDYQGGQSNSNEHIGFMRIMATNKSLMIMRWVIMKFIKESSSLSEKAMMRMDEQMGIAIQGAIQDTLEAVKRPSNDMSDVLHAFLELFINDSDKVYAENFDDFYMNQKLVFRNGKTIYFRGKSMAAYLSGILNRDVSTKELSKELLRAKLLVPQSGGYSEKLSKRVKHSKKMKNTRFYMVNVRALIDLEMSVFPSIFDRCHSPLKELLPEGYRK